jgi:hypothetical protein
MMQCKLFKPVRREKTIKSQTRDYDRGNLHAAHEILADPNQYGGIDGAMFTWAQEVLARLEGRSDAAL